MTKLEEYIKENNLSRNQLAQICNVSPYLLRRVMERKMWQVIHFSKFQLQQKFA